MRATSSVLPVLICLLTFSQRTSGQIKLEPVKPAKGEVVMVSVDPPADSLLLVYRPNSALAREEWLVSDQGDGYFQWTPSDAGVVAMTAGGQIRNVSVRFAGVSTSGIVVMVLAFCLLFGGAFFAFRLLFSDPESAEHSKELDVTHRPDT